jgi:nitrogen fixation protein FixH
MNWGVKIIISFAVFGILMGVLITISFNQEINLVAEDYYKQEIEYEGQMEKIRNSASLSQRPELNYNSEKKILDLIFPIELAGNFIEGEIHFFRPSDYKMDRKVKVVLDEGGRQAFDLSGLEKGLWEAKFTWVSDSEAYYEEKTIVI